MELMKYKINEIFYSIQGEGIRKGTPNIFIRFSGCTAEKVCAKKGIVCDTNYEDYTEYTGDGLVEEIQKITRAYGCKNIIWTGGEPTDQLTKELAINFRYLGYYQAIECSGIRIPTDMVDFITLSPKLTDKQICKIWQHQKIDEIRMVLHKGQDIDDLIRLALNYDYFFISPHFDGEDPNWDNINYCIKYVKEHPSFRLSLQEHKFLRIR